MYLAAVSLLSCAASWTGDTQSAIQAALRQSSPDSREREVTGAMQKMMHMEPRGDMSNSQDTIAVDPSIQKLLVGLADIPIHPSPTLASILTETEEKKAEEMVTSIARSIPAVLTDLGPAADQLEQRLLDAAVTVANNISNPALAGPMTEVAKMGLALAKDQRVLVSLQSMGARLDRCDDGSQACIGGVLAVEAPSIAADVHACMGSLRPLLAVLQKRSQKTSRFEETMSTAEVSICTDNVICDTCSSPLRFIREVGCRGTMFTVDFTYQFKNWDFSFGPVVGRPLLSKAVNFFFGKQVSSNYKVLLLVSSNWEAFEGETINICVKVWVFWRPEDVIVRGPGEPRPDWPSKKTGLVGFWLRFWTSWDTARFTSSRPAMFAEVVPAQFFWNILSKQKIYRSMYRVGVAMKNEAYTVFTKAFFEWEPLRWGDSLSPWPVNTTKKLYRDSQLALTFFFKLPSYIDWPNPEVWEKILHTNAWQQKWVNLSDAKYQQAASAV